MIWALPGPLWKSVILKFPVSSLCYAAILCTLFVFYDIYIYIFCYFIQEVLLLHAQFPCWIEFLSFV